MNEDRVFLDWAATAPLCEEAFDAMEPFLRPGTANLTYGGNANSLHTSGRRAFAALEEARASLMRDLKAQRPDEIVFTSGATEADNAAVQGIVSACRKRASMQGKSTFRPHLITSLIEHDAVLEAAHILATQGCEVTYLKPDRQGFIEARAFEAALQENTVLASIQMANNEIGSIQAIKELAFLAHDAGVFFHTDAVQALGKIEVDLSSLGVDAASFSAHKIGGSKGSGILYLRTNTPFDPLLVGGGQEFGKRSGTQNVCAAAGFAAACGKACALQEQEKARLQLLRDYLYAELGALEGIEPVVEVEKGSYDYLPHIVTMYSTELESETMILRLDIKGFEVSGGSACASQSLKPSHVLHALGLPDDSAYGLLRISMGRYTTRSEVECFVQAFKSCLLGC